MPPSMWLAECSAPEQDARPGTPIFVFLSPGVDVAASVEHLGHKLGFTAENGRQVPLQHVPFCRRLACQCRA